MSHILDFDRKRTCCFTGHRSRDLPHEGDRDSFGMKNLVSTLELLIQEAINEGYDTFISGMAEGVDLICAEIVNGLAARDRSLRLVCALPYPLQVREMPSFRARYMYELIKSRHPYIYVSPAYTKDCYKLRNQFMVDHSSKIIGVMKEKQKGSGTLQTVRMAREAGLDMHIIKLEDNPSFYL